MSEYWVSRDKYFCKYCKIYIADDVPSRTLHETGFRHKGNYERFIREIYKKGEKDVREKAEEAREMERINAAAELAMQADGMAVASTSAAPLPASRKSKPTASSDPFANYSTPESLGYVDVEGDKQVAEAEVRQSEGRIGEWQKVVKVPKLVEKEKVEEEEDHKFGEGEEEEKAELEDVVFKKANYFDKEKTRGLRDDELYDPSSVGIKLKKRRLTLREEQELREERERKEMEKKVKREEREKKERAFAKSGWNEVEIEEEPILMFDEEEEDKPIPGEDESGEVGGSGEKKPKRDEEVEKKPLFKKRRPNSAARS